MVTTEERERERKEKGRKVTDQERERAPHGSLAYN